MLFSYFFPPTESRFLQPDFISNALACANPVVLGFQIERIILSTISLTGLENITVNNVVHFRDKNHLHYIFASAKSGSNTLYIPEAWNYATIDAVLVSYHYRDEPKPSRGRSGKSSRSNAKMKQVSAIDSQPNVATSTIDCDLDLVVAPHEQNVKQVLDYAQVQFIQISNGSVTTEKLHTTRKILMHDSEVRSMWRQSVSESIEDVRFRLRWIVPSNSVTVIQSTQASAGVRDLEFVCSLASVNQALKHASRFASS